MNAVERVRDKFKKEHTLSVLSEYSRGYLKALDDVQDELSVECLSDYESENMKLKCEVEELNSIIEDLKDNLQFNEQLVYVEKEKLQAQLDIVKMIFGGK